ncbi:type II toxin-antitoxin system VapC family toxin [Candidatus Gottesmanbacteria bacterium]|nr:type II toxin-antitoxin system VapC family toxin [Candidatus Gottesmanbacteria bacterium]
MEKIIIPDASVVYKWLVDEPGEDTRKARKIRERYVMGESEILVPSLLFIEIGNVLVWKSSLTTADLHVAWSLFLQYKLPVASVDAQFVEGAMDVARMYSISLYDATYVSLAQSKQGEMITADKKLVRAVNKPFVRLL